MFRLAHRNRGTKDLDPKIIDAIGSTVVVLTGVGLTPMLAESAYYPDQNQVADFTE